MHETRKIHADYSLRIFGYAKDRLTASAPENAAEAQITIVENLIGDILDEVNAGAGYGMTSSCADTRICKAVMADQTGGYGYAILSAISNNAL